MDHISTKELAERWNVSVTRILNLVKEGRLPGAKLIGKSWVFPIDIEKPEDKRRKENKADARRPHFRFPVYHYTRYTPAEVENDFTEDERSLYKAEQFCFNGRDREAAEMLESLIQNTNDPYVEFGALYCYCITSVHLTHYREACAAYREIRRIFDRETDHKKELEFLIHDLETYFEGNRFYLERFNVKGPHDFPEHMRIYLLVESAYSDMLKAAMNGIYVNPLPYALCLEMEAAKLSPLSETLLRAYLAGIYQSQGDRENCAYHLRKACRIAEENDLERSISFLMHYARDIFQYSLQDDRPEQLKRLEDLSAKFIHALHGLFEYTEKFSILQNLDAKDSSLIIYAQKGLTNKEIADIMHLSMATISKKYSRLYEKTMTHSKSELARLYTESMLEF